MVEFSRVISLGRYTKYRVSVNTTPVPTLNHVNLPCQCLVVSVLLVIVITVCLRSGCCNKIPDWVV